MCKFHVDKADQLLKMTMESGCPFLTLAIAAEVVYNRVSDHIREGSMNYRIDPTSAKPAYIQLYEQIRRDIIGGIYPSRSRLPSKRLIAEETGVSVITVEHAYALLLDEGYVESRERSGYFVRYEENGFYLPATEQVIREVPGNSSSVGTEFPFSVLARTMRRVLAVYGERILIKPPNRGCHELRTAIAEYLARSRGILVSSNQIVIGSGAEYLYGLLLQTFGREVKYAVETPSYEKIEQVYRANGVSFDRLALGRDGILTEELRRTEAGILHVTPFRSYPTGITATAGKRREYLRWVRERNGWIIEDDFSSEFTVSHKPEDTIFSLAGGNRVIYINSFSQTIAPSMRIGYMILPDEAGLLFEEKAGFYSCTVPAYEQYVLAEFIASGEFERHINRTRRRLRAGLNGTAGNETV